MSSLEQQSVEHIQLNAPAVTAVSIMTGAGTVLELIPPVMGSISSVIGVCLALYLLKHRKAKVRLDIATEKLLAIQTETAELALKKMKSE